MMMAQRLYEAGHITYMRTDSTNLSSEAVDACRELITKDFGKIIYRTLLFAMVQK